MVKNFVISALYKVPGHNFKYYKTLEKFSSKTYQKKYEKILINLYYLLVKKKNHQQMFYDIFLKTWELWKSEPCNIFLSRY